MDSRERIIAAVTFISGLYWVVEFVLPQPVVTSLGLAELHEPISYGFVTVGAAAIGLGLANLIIHHGRVILFRGQGAWSSAVLLVGMFGMLLVGSIEFISQERLQLRLKDVERLRQFSNSICERWDGFSRQDVIWRLRLWDESTQSVVAQHRNELEKFQGTGPRAASHNAAVSALTQLEEARLEVVNLQTSDNITKERVHDAIVVKPRLATLTGNLATAYQDYLRLTINSGIYTVLTEGVFNSLAAAMFSLLAVYIAAAAYRAFRVSNRESLLMMVAALLVILGQTPFGVAISSQLPKVRLWLLEVPSGAAFRAIKFGAGVAGLILAMRMWLSLDNRATKREGERHDRR